MGLLSDPLLAHYVGLIIGMLTAAVIFLDLSIILDTNWNIFTSRVFLKKEQFMKTFIYMTHLLSFAVLLMLATHILAILGEPVYVVYILQMVVTASLAGVMLMAFLMKKDLAQTQIKE